MLTVTYVCFCNTIKVPSLEQVPSLELINIQRLACLCVIGTQKIHPTAMETITLSSKQKPESGQTISS